MRGAFQTLVYPQLQAFTWLQLSLHFSDRNHKTDDNVAVEPGTAGGSVTRRADALATFWNSKRLRRARVFLLGRPKSSGWWGGLNPTTGAAARALDFAVLEDMAKEQY